VPHLRSSVRVLATKPMPYLRATTALPPEVHSLIDPQDPALDFIIDALDAMRCVGCDMSNPTTIAVAVEGGQRRAAEIAAALESGEFERDQRWRAEVEETLSRSGLSLEPEVLSRCLVYYVRLGNRCKIGFTSSLRQRMMVIQPEEILAVEPGGRTLENQRHKQFAALRVVGEWFRYEGSLVDHVEALRKG
jgi:hypothetical protein